MSGNERITHGPKSDISRIAILAYIGTELSQVQVDYKVSRLESAEKVKKTLTSVAKHLDKLNFFKDDKAIKLVGSEDLNYLIDTWITNTGELMVHINDSKNEASGNSFYRQASDLEYIVLFDDVKAAIGNLLYPLFPSNI